jgi:hypothetical protein
MDKVQNKPNSSVQHTPSSESFQVNKGDDETKKEYKETSAILQMTRLPICFEL